MSCQETSRVTPRAPDAMWSVIALFVALLACRSTPPDEHHRDGDLLPPPTGGTPIACESDDDCEPDECCPGYFNFTCTKTIPTDPMESLCSTRTSNGEASCWCYAPQSEPVCPILFKEPPFEPECGAAPYVRCAAFCDAVPQTLCMCDTAGTVAEQGDAGIEVPTCPPDWATVCPTEAGVGDAAGD